MVIQSHIEGCTRTVLCVALIKMCIVSSVLISPWERVWFTHTGLECGCTRLVSPGTTAENFFARPQYCIFAVHSCMCELKYGGLPRIDSAFSDCRTNFHKKSACWYSIAQSHIRSSFLSEYEIQRSMGLHGLAVSGSNFSGYHADLHEGYGPWRIEVWTF